MKVPAKRDDAWLASRPQRLRSKDSFVTLVVGVPDGDTLQVAKDWDGVSFVGTEFVRLAGVDAPEMRSRDLVGATRAQKELHRLCFQKVVTVRPRRVWRDPYHRIVADVTLDHIDLGACLISSGFAQARVVFKADTKPM